jgi:hypothetical protein
VNDSETLLTPLLAELARSDRVIYCAASLFSPIARIAAANVAGHLEVEIAGRLARAGISRPSQPFVFLPYRDSGQTSLAGADRARLIYEADLDQLQNSAALVARLDGLSKDSGVAMEIGFAYGTGLPVGVLVTDFMGEGFVGSGPRWHVDPIVRIMAAVAEVWPDSSPVRGSYYQTNLVHETMAVSAFVQRCLNELRPSHPNCNKVSANGMRVHIEIMGGRYEWARSHQQELSDALSRIGWHVTAATRYCVPHDETTFVSAIQRDLESACAADAILLSGDAAEADAGGSALFGMGRAMQKHLVLISSSATLYAGSGGQIMKTNLMLEYSANIVTRSLSETIEHFRSLSESSRGN